MQKIDIRKIKNEYRAKAKEYRASLTEEQKKCLDSQIFKNLSSVLEYDSAKTILCYMSTSSEVDTKGIISSLFEQNKTVAVPRCIDDTRDMEFYIISSFEDTYKRTFGVFEPDSDKCMRLRDFRNAVCILPGLAFDREGYRLGYGKGYYDRFLSSFKGVKIGIVYEKCLFDRLMHGFFDVPADIVVTEKQVYYIKGKNNGRK